MSLYRGAGGASDATDDSTVNAVAGYASAAAASATAANADATLASNSASASAASATAAASSASTAFTYSNNASSAANAANTRATAALNSANAAAASATSASASAGSASSSYSQAAAASNSANTSANSAATSATSAASSASAAASSAASALAIYGNTTAMNDAVTAAANSATSAATQASNAASSASNAASSVTQANAAVASASSYADSAQASANNAANSASSALAIYGNTTAMSQAVQTATTSATQASSSATSAASSASSAATSATAAASSATSAATSAASASAVSLGNEPVRPTVRPSLLLDFANTKQLDPRITFTRASTATYYDGRTVAKAEENLVLQSQAYAIGSWQKNILTATDNAATAPDGTSTASLVQVSSGTAVAPRLVTSVITGVASTPYVFSIYAKAGTNNYLQIAALGASIFCNFDLSTGVLGTSGSCTGTITSAGNGWYRCSIAFTSSGTDLRALYVIENSSSAAYVGNWNPTGTETIYLWGAQVEQRSAVTAYTATTTAPITNYIPALQTAASGVARFDHNPTTGESLGLLIEESRTNLALRSQDLTSSWIISGVTATSNQAVAPDGTVTANLFVPTTAIASHVVYQSILTVSTAYTVSVYAKAAGLRYLALSNSGASAQAAIFDLQSGVVSSTGASATATITPVGDNWYRCACTFTAAYAGFSIYASTSGTSFGSFAGDGYNGYLIWGAQAEAGAFATSYIPTTSAQVTRGAETATMSGTSFSTWWNQQAGSLYVEGDCPVDASNNDRTLSFINDNTTTNGYVVRFAGTTKNAQSYGSNAGTANQWVLSQGTNYSGLTAKMALGYAVNDVGFVVNSTVAGTDTSALLGVANKLDIGHQNGSGSWLCGHVKKLAYFPARVTNAQLQGMTTV